MILKSQVDMKCLVLMYKYLPTSLFDYTYFNDYRLSTIVGCIAIDLMVNIKSLRYGFPAALDARTVPLDVSSDSLRRLLVMRYACRCCSCFISFPKMPKHK